MAVERYLTAVAEWRNQWLGHFNTNFQFSNDSYVNRFRCRTAAVTAPEHPINPTHYQGGPKTLTRYWNKITIEDDK